MAWKTVEIGSFLKERGDRFKPEEANTLDLKRIKKIDFQGKIHVVDHKPTKTNMILVKKGDLVISGINVEKGALAVYEDDKDALATIHYSSYEYDKNQVDIEYLKWFLKSRTFQNIVKEQAGGGIKTELKAKKFLPLKIQLPGLDEQIDIARKIDNVAAEIDDLSETNNHNQTLLIQLRQAILQEAVQGKLILQDPNDEPASELLKRIKAEKEKLIAEGKIKKQKPLPPIAEDEIFYELPQGWKWVRFNELQKITEYGTSQKASEVNVGVPVLRMNNINSGVILYNKLKYVVSTIKDLPRLYLKKYDLLFNRTNSFELVGKTGIFIDEDNKYTFASYLIRVSFFNDLIVPHYINLYLNSLVFRKSQIEPLIIQQCGQANVSGTKLKNTLVPIPPFEEQKRIVAKVDQLMHLCDELETRLSQSKKDSEMLMQAVLHEAFS
jgi:type I restriction enzyme S subunit